eukprot:Ihof_evm5s399 gene=Ihof_evmTU5s399
MATSTNINDNNESLEGLINMDLPTRFQPLSTSTPIHSFIGERNDQEKEPITVPTGQQMNNMNGQMNAATTSALIGLQNPPQNPTHNPNFTLDLSSHGLDQTTISSVDSLASTFHQASIHYPPTPSILENPLSDTIQPAPLAFKKLEDSFLRGLGRFQNYDGLSIAESELVSSGSDNEDRYGGVEREGGEGRRGRRKGKGVKGNKNREKETEGQDEDNETELQGTQEQDVVNIGKEGEREKKRVSGAIASPIRLANQTTGTDHIPTNQKENGENNGVIPGHKPRPHWPTFPETILGNRLTEEEKIDVMYTNQSPFLSLLDDSERVRDHDDPSLPIRQSDQHLTEDNGKGSTPSNPMKTPVGQANYNHSTTITPPLHNNKPITCPQSAPPSFNQNRSNVDVDSWASALRKEQHRLAGVEPINQYTSQPDPLETSPHTPIINRSRVSNITGSPIHRLDYKNSTGLITGSAIKKRGTVGYDEVIEKVVGDKVLSSNKEPVIVLVPDTTNLIEPGQKGWIVIANQGEREVQYAAVSDAGRVTVSPSTGHLAPNSSISLELRRNNDAQITSSTAIEKIIIVIAGSIHQLNVRLLADPSIQSKPTMNTLNHPESPITPITRMYSHTLADSPKKSPGEVNRSNYNLWTPTRPIKPRRLQLSVDSIHFDPTRIGTKRILTVPINNPHYNTSVKLIVGIQVANGIDSFKLKHTRLNLSPRTYVNLPITFCPTSPGPITATFYVFEKPMADKAPGSGPNLLGVALCQVEGVATSTDLYIPSSVNVGLDGRASSLPITNSGDKSVIASINLDPTKGLLAIDQDRIKIEPNDT